MLKSLDTSKTFENLHNRKCAEVFYQTEDHFLIVCVFCKMKFFELNDLLLHFKNVHLQQSTYTLRSIDDKSDSEMVDEIEVYLEVTTAGSTLQGDTAELIADANESKAQQCAVEPKEDDEDSDYVPEITENRTQAEDDLSPGGFKCELCDKAFKYKATLSRHKEKFHDQTRTNRCTRCDSEFPDYRQLCAHFKEEHGGYPCTQCPKVFKAKDSLHVHLLVHSGIRKFVCDFENCGKAFFNGKSLSSHKRHVHSSERNFVCEMCGYRTNVKGALTIHKRYHTGEKPFICKICNKGFASHSLLSIHKPTHSTERPHVCEVCGKSFALQKALYHHKHLHLGVKKFVCKICDRAYAQASGLSAHMRQHKDDVFKS